MVVRTTIDKARNIVPIAVILMMAIGLFVSCDDSVVYHHYESIDKTGWAVRDSMTFHVDSIPDSGRYTTLVCLRVNATYPYRNMATMVTQYVMPRNTMVRKTVTAEVKKKNGTIVGDGVTYYTYEVPVAQTQLSQGDSLLVVVKHRMRREVMPGIMDVGVKIERADK